jgi:hypothetical protein
MDFSHLISTATIRNGIYLGLASYIINALGVDVMIQQVLPVYGSLPMMIHVHTAAIYAVKGTLMFVLFDIIASLGFLDSYL